jgi:hypothetical protein
VLKATDPLGLETDTNGVRVGATTVHSVDVDVAADGSKTVTYKLKESSTAAKTIAAPAAWAPPNLIEGTTFDENGVLDPTPSRPDPEPIDTHGPDGFEEGVVNALAQAPTEPVLGLLRNLTDKPPGDYSPVRPFPNGDDVLGNVFVQGLLLGVSFAGAGSSAPRLALTPPKLSLSFGSAEAGAGASTRALPGLAELPAEVAVPIRSAEAFPIPRALTPTEMAALTNTSGNIEFSQTFSGGQHWLTRASFQTPNRVQVLPWNSDTAWISHSHPSGYSGLPSGADRNVLQLLGQDASRVVRPDGSSLRFGQ